MVSTVDRAASGIRALIVSGRYGPGDRLPSERELAADLAVSRPALREGIRRLRSGGVLESRRGSGTYVAKVDIDGVYDIRELLEPLAAKRASQLRTAREVAEIRATIERMREHMDDDPDAFDLADARFHSLVAAASGSPLLSDILNRLSELALLTRTVVSTSPRLRKASFVDVERVCIAIERQHPKRAAQAMERHILHVREGYQTVTESSETPALRPAARRRQRSGDTA